MQSPLPIGALFITWVEINALQLYFKQSSDVFEMSLISNITCVNDFSWTSAIICKKNWKGTGIAGVYRST